jgi:hypothetical protein
MLGLVMFSWLPMEHTWVVNRSQHQMEHISAVNRSWLQMEHMWVLRVIGNA